MECATGNFCRNPLSNQEREDDTAREREVTHQGAKEHDRIDEKPGHDKKCRNKERIREKLQLSLRRFISNRCINCQTCKECPDYTWQIDALCQDAGHGHNSKHQDKVGVFVIFKLLQ